MPACSGASRRRSCGRARRSCATSAGSSSRCTAAARSARTCSRRRAPTRSGSTRGSTEIDDLLHGERHAPRCECGAPILRGSHFCPNCGRALDASRNGAEERLGAMASSKREAAIAAADRICPRCAPPRTREQSYCVNCGLRLPPSSGRLASLRRGWMRRFGWYPGDWIWVSLPTLVVAIAGARGRDRARAGRRRAERRHHDRRRRRRGCLGRADADARRRAGRARRPRPSPAARRRPRTRRPRRPPRLRAERQAHLAGEPPTAGRSCSSRIR